MVEQRNSDSGTVEQRWWNSGTVMMEQCNRDYGREEQLWWNSGKKSVETAEQ